MVTSNYQLDNFYINSRLSELFTPIKDLNNKLVYQMNEGINSKLIMNGIQLNKIGIFDPSELVKVSLSKSDLIQNTQSLKKNNSKKQQSFFTDCNLHLNQQNAISSNIFINSNDLYPYPPLTSKISAALVRKTATNIENSMMIQQKQIDQIKPFDMALGESCKDIFGLIENKNRKFITQEMEEDNKFTIEANKMTKRILNQNIISNPKFNDICCNEFHESNNCYDKNDCMINTFSTHIGKCKKNIRLFFKDLDNLNIIYQCINILFDHYRFT